MAGQMCIAVPVKILALDGERATVDYGGLKRVVSISLVKSQVQVGDYVIIHAGCAIQRIDPAEAQETIALMQEMLGES
ncbi:MAG: HypC/HybG/HupF family hydrogenase formation chaperone [Candidatus Sigynarchaeota archaeon]